jgi:hypothetical protein
MCIAEQIRFLFPNPWNLANETKITVFDTYIKAYFR